MQRISVQSSNQYTDTRLNNDTKYYVINIRSREDICVVKEQRSKQKPRSRTKRRRRKKNKNISNSSAINNSDGDDLKKVTLEEINEDMDNITVCTENMSIISADEEFLMIMRGGLGLQAVTNFGTTRMVTVCIDNDRLSWGVSRSKPAMFVPVDQIALVQVGMPLKLASSFSQSDRDRSFNIVLSKDNKTATFLAPTPLERDALVHGFAMIVTTRNSNHIERCDSHTQQL